MKELKISAIKNGTVIDHIPTGVALKLVSLLELDKDKSIVSVATNLDSVKMGRKGIVKIADRFLTDDEVNKVALIAPNATLSTIRDYRVESKHKLSIPSKIHKIVRCINPNCITNHENIATKFSVVEESPLILKCHYCEKYFSGGEIQIR